MNLLQSLLCQTLSLSLPELEPALREQLDLSPLVLSDDELHRLLRCEPEMRDSLWKVSLTLQLPHQWLFDAFQLQVELSPLTANAEFQWPTAAVCC